MNNKSFLLLDCTVRDGGYVNNWDFPLETVQNMYVASAQAGTDIFEIGFWDMDETKSLWKRCPPDAVKAVRKDGSLKISVMLEDSTAGMPVGTPEETGVDIIRVALNKDKVAHTLPKLTRYKEQGYEVYIQLMGITSYTDLEILQMITLVESSGNADFVNIGDSYGSLAPKNTAHIISLMKRNTKLKVGLHPHNNMQLGMANIIAAIDAGADVVDGSMYGMGRGGGNVPLELILSYYGRIYTNRFDVTPVLNFIDMNMLRLRDQYEWGYSLPALLSGAYECHPYYTSKLVAKREYTIEEILKTVKLVSESNVIGFSAKLLQQIVENGFVMPPEYVEDSIRLFVEANKNKASYQQRHTGRNFVILANGLTLATHQELINQEIVNRNAVVIGSNNLDGMFVPNYHSFSSQRRFEKYINTVSEKSIILLGPNIQTKGLVNSYENIICYNSSETDLVIQDGVITSNCRSIALLNAAVALVMGAKRIAFAGFDGYKDGSLLFYAEEESKDIKDVLQKHLENQRYLDMLIQCANNLNCEVEFITPTTYDI